MDVDFTCTGGNKSTETGTTLEPLFERFCTEYIVAVTKLAYVFTFSYKNLLR